jgi:hypothetical protein
MRGSSLTSLVAMASLFVACATGSMDTGQLGVFGDDAGETVQASDSGTGGSSGGVSGSSSGSSGGSSGGSSRGSGSTSGSGGGGDDGSVSADSGDDGSGGSGSSSGGLPDSGSSSGGQDSGTGSTYCVNNAVYYAEAVLAVANKQVVPCFPAGCQAGQCCFQAINQVPISLCVQQ